MSLEDPLLVFLGLMIVLHMVGYTLARRTQQPCP